MTANICIDQQGRGQKLIIICVDGALPDMVQKYGFFKYRQALQWDQVTRLKSVYPSSTASAHASMLTGSYPETHGIVGNRFWLNETKGVIDRAKGSPLECLHPYERVTQTAPSLLDVFSESRQRVVAVQFPGTFSLNVEQKDSKSVYCLYLPAKELSLPLRKFSSKDSCRQAFWRFSHYGMDFDLEIRVGTHDRSDFFEVSSLDSRVICANNSEFVDVHCIDKNRAISFSLKKQKVEESSLSIYRTTAVLTLCFGSLNASKIISCQNSPHSRNIDYSAAPEHDFYESPNVVWTTQTALRLLDENPDVLLLRYSQVDHAQEYLYWYTVKGSEEQKKESLAQILEVYRAVELGIAQIMEYVGWDTPAFIFSDHGIDYVDRHIHINSLLITLEMDNYVFQGDSTCAFLYGERPITTQQYQKIKQQISKYQPWLRIASQRELEELRVYRPDRCGHLAVFCANHCEIQYGDGPVVEEVRSASHGFRPNLPTMDGIWIPLRGFEERPTSSFNITDLFSVLMNFRSLAAGC